jgi:fructoselysine-6-P-deglycase FrlB-like protein
LSLDTAALEERIRSLANAPLIAIGSGGSQSTAVLLADLHQIQFGQVAKADTPLIARNYLRTLKSLAIVLISGGGRNPDILGVAKIAVECEPQCLISLCATKESPLAGIVEGFARGFSFDFALPTRKDGFLATKTPYAFSNRLGVQFGTDRH